MVLVKLLERLYRPLLSRAARQILQGRLLDPREPERGRWLRADVDAFEAALWRRSRELLPVARLGAIPDVGNRHNVYLAVLTTAAYQALLEQGVQRKYAMTLMADIGWKVYAWMLGAAALPFRWTARDPATRMRRALKALMAFPFSAAGRPGRPGYEVVSWTEGDRFYTHWTRCPPLDFVRRLVRERGDRGELEAFSRSWCTYDWAGADLLAGDGRHGHYERPHTLSRGDSVCDMCWIGRAECPSNQTGTDADRAWAAPVGGPG